MSVTIALMFFFTVYVLEMVGKGTWFRPWARGLLGDYAYPVRYSFIFVSAATTHKHLEQIATIFWTGFAHFPGQLRATNVSKLPHTRAFYPTVDRGWLIDFWNLEVKWIFVALPIGFLLMLLFYYDHVGAPLTRIDQALSDYDLRTKVASQHKQSNFLSRSQAVSTGISFCSDARASLQESSTFPYQTDWSRRYINLTTFSSPC